MRAALLVLLLLAACASRPLAPEPPDAGLARLSHTGQLAFRQGRPDQATGLFREALARARARDDATAITDQGINLAAAELRRRDDTAARDVAQDVREELGRRGAPVPPELLLAEATARWRLSDPRAEAQARAAAAVPSGADAGDLWLRAGRAAAGDFDRRNAEIWLARAAAGSGSAARDARAALAKLRAS